MSWFKLYKQALKAIPDIADSLHKIFETLEDTNEILQDIANQLNIPPPLPLAGKFVNKQEIGSMAIYLQLPAPIVGDVVTRAVTVTVPSGSPQSFSHTGTAVYDDLFYGPVTGASGEDEEQLAYTVQDTDNAGNVSPLLESSGAAPDVTAPPTPSEGSFVNVPDVPVAAPLPAKSKK